MAERAKILRWRAPIVGVLAVVLVTAGGCVHRRMTIRSNPPGATVYVDDYEIGTTPVSTNFTYYGSRKVRLVKDGYETLTVLQSVPPPWYEIPPLDLVTENFVPGEIRDQRQFCYQLRPQAVTPAEQLIERASQLRYAVPTSAVAPAIAPAMAPAVAPAVPPAPVTPVPEPAPLTIPAPAPSMLPPPGLGPAPSYGTPAPSTPSDFGGQPMYPLPPSGR